MMKLIGSVIPRQSVSISRVLSRVSFFSLRSWPGLPPTESLHKKIWSSTDPSISMVSLLDPWLNEGRTVNRADLTRLIKQLHQHSRFAQALEISEWMSERLELSLSPGDMAVRLSLIAKVRGVSQAEEYFNAIPSSSRIDKVHGALLNSYAENNLLEKADDFFQKMSGLGFVNLALTYNTMLSLYSRMGKHKEFNFLLQEMVGNGIKFDNFTYVIRLNALAVTSDVEGLDKLITEMEADPQLNMDIHAYFVVAKGYLKADLLEKALITLRKIEYLSSTDRKTVYYEHLLTLYAAAGKKEDVLRIWKQYKSCCKITNTSYLALLSSLLKLDDFDGVESFLKEWEHRRKCFDNRIVNLVISSYCKKGYFKKAFTYVEQLVRKGYKLEASIWQCLANHCCMSDRMEKAVDYMRKAAVAGGRACDINSLTLVACVEYLKRDGKRETALEILELFRKRGSLSDGVHNRLVGFVKGGDACVALDAMKEDGDLATNEN